MNKEEKKLLKSVIRIKEFCENNACCRCPLFDEDNNACFVMPDPNTEMVNPLPWEWITYEMEGRLNGQ